jgi:hypothetical protein
VSLPHYLPDLYSQLAGHATDACGTLSPSRMRRVLLLFLRGHWSGPQNHPADLETLQCLHWDPNPADRKVEVELQGAQVGASAPHAIWLAVGNFQFNERVLDSISGVTDDNTTEYRTLIGTCQVLISHEAPYLDQAYDMAWSDLCFMLGFIPSIRDALGGESLSIKPKVLGEPQLKQPEPKTNYRVDLGLEFDITLGVATQLESHLLKHVSTTSIPR